MPASEVVMVQLVAGREDTRRYWCRCRSTVSTTTGDDLGTVEHPAPNVEPVTSSPRVGRSSALLAAVVKVSPSAHSLLNRGSPSEGIG